MELLRAESIGRRAQALFTLADQRETRLNSARQVVDRLTPAPLAKAFRGQRVPRDPCDEPASVCCSTGLLGRGGRPARRRLVRAAPRGVVANRLQPTRIRPAWGSNPDPPQP